MPEVTTLPVLIQLSWVALGGALGGIAEMLSKVRFDKNKHDPEAVYGELHYDDIRIKFKNFALFLVFSLIIGIAGSSAIEFILIVLGSYKNEMTAQSQMYIFSISVAAGFAAKKLLPKIAINLEKQVSNIEKKNERQDDMIAQQRLDIEDQKKALIALYDKNEKARLSSEESLLFLTCKDAQMGDASPSLIKKCTQDLELHLSEKPNSRKAAFQLSRLYKINKEYDKAIICMDKFIETIRQEADAMVKLDLADALYNKSCYAALLWRDEDKQEDKDNSLKWLKESIELEKANIKDAEVDPDFDKFRSSKNLEFTKILADN